MPKQLDINFDAFPDGIFKKVYEVHDQVYINELLKKIQHQHHVIAGYRSQEEQRKKTKHHEQTDKK